MSALDALAATIRADGGLLADTVTDPTEDAALGELAGPGYEELVEAIYEGYLQHYGEGRVLRPDDPDLALLAGDRLYALGLARLAELGDLEAVDVLAGVISRAAQAHAEGDPDAARAAWEAGARAVGRVCAPERQLRPDFPRRSILFAPSWPPPAKSPSRSTPPTGRCPGAFEGETVTRRRFMTLTAHGAGAVAAMAFTLPALGFAVGSRAVRPPAGPLGGRRQARGLPGRRLHPQGHHLDDGIGEVGKTTVYMRRRNDKIDSPPNPPGYDEQAIAISTRCMHLGCPVRYVAASRALHLPVPRRRLRLPGQGRRRPAGAPARPLLHARARRHRRGRPALLGQLRAQALRLLPRPGAGPRRHRPVPLPAALLDPEAVSDEAAQDPAPAAAAAAAQAPGRADARRRPTRPRRRGSTPSAGSTSGPRCPAPAAG